MPLVSSVDYSSSRIYLSAETVNTDIDTLDVYREVRALRASTETHRGFHRMIISGGNITKIPDVSATPIFVQLLNGCRIVPYDTAHDLKLVRDTFSDDGVAGRDCFDRSTLTNNVNIDVDFPRVEVRITETGVSGLTAEEASSLAKLDQITVTAGNVHADIKSVNAITVQGDGTESNPFGP